MADINNIETIQDLKDCIAEYLKTPRVPAINGSELNILLSKTIELVPGGTQTAAEIKGLLESLTGSNRLDASAIKNLPSGGGGQNLQEVTEQGASTTEPLTLDSFKINVSELSQTSKILWIGDSYGSGSGAFSSAERFTTLSSQFLNLTEDNRCIPGSVVSSYFDSADIPIKTTEYAYFVIALGTNEVDSVKTQEEFENDYNTLVDQILAKGWLGTDLILISIYGGVKYPNATPTEESQMVAFNSSIENIASERGGQYVDVFNTLRSDVYGGLSFIRFDGLHTNGYGHIALGKIVASQVLKKIFIDEQRVVVEGETEFTKIKLLDYDAVDDGTLIGYDKNGNIVTISALYNVRTTGRFILGNSLIQKGADIPSGFNYDTDWVLTGDTKLSVFFGTNSFFESTWFNGAGKTIFKNTFAGFEFWVNHVSAGTAFQTRKLVSFNPNGTVTIGETETHSSAILALNTTEKGFMTPRMTTTERDTITGVEEGLEIYNLTLHKKQFYNGSAWETINSA